MVGPGKTITVVEAVLQLFCCVVGTGKTITVVEAVLQLFTLLPHSRLLLATPSNSAADLLTERLHSSGVVGPGVMARLNAYQRNEQVCLCA